VISSVVITSPGAILSRWWKPSPGRQTGETFPLCRSSVRGSTQRPLHGGSPSIRSKTRDGGTQPEDEIAFLNEQRSGYTARLLTVLRSSWRAIKYTISDRRASSCTHVSGCRLMASPSPNVLTQTSGLEICNKFPSVAPLSVHKKLEHRYILQLVNGRPA
jgi:hypothetical protein